MREKKNPNVRMVGIVEIIGESISNYYQYRRHLRTYKEGKMLRVRYGTVCITVNNDGHFDSQCNRNHSKYDST